MRSVVCYLANLSVIILLIQCASEEESSFRINIEDNGTVGPSDLSYKVPENGEVYFVSPEGNSQNTGSIDSPLSIEKALEKASSNSTVILRGGIYLTGNNIIGKNITIQPYLNEKPIFKGSEHIPASQWTKESGQRWQTKWEHCFKKTTDNPEINSDLVWFNDERLLAATSKNKVDNTHFHINCSKKQLVIGINPASGTVEATRYGVALERVNQKITGDDQVDDEGIKVRGITFKHFAYHAVHIRASKATIENNTFINNVYRALLTFRDNHTIRNNAFINNYLTALLIQTSENTVVNNNYMQHNSLDDAQPKEKERSAIIRAANSVNIQIAGNLIEDNGGHGVWFDVHSRDNLVARNTIRNNLNSGVFCEISRRNTIIGNIFTGNEHGVHLINCDGNKIYNNTFIDNGQNVHINEYKRDDEDALKNPVRNSSNNEILNNIFSNATFPDWPFAMVTVRSSLCGKWKKVKNIDYNAYYRTDIEQPRHVIRWNDIINDSRNNLCRNKKNKKPVTHPVLADFQQSIKMEKNGLEFTGPDNPFFANSENDELIMKESTEVIGAGASLSQDLATILDVQPGSKVTIGATQ